jgi:hypothetical protein
MVQRVLGQSKGGTFLSVETEAFTGEIVGCRSEAGTLVMVFAAAPGRWELATVVLCG